MVLDAETSQKLDNYFENRLEYAKFLVNPTVEEAFPEITKDLALSNLDEWGIIKLGIEIEIVNTLLLYPHLFKQSIFAYLRDIYSLLQLYRSRNGFESILQRTTVSDNKVDTKITEVNNKKKFVFGFGKDRPPQT